MSRISIELVSDFNQFRALAQEWEEFSAQRVNTVFLSYLWLQEWWHVYGANYEIWTTV